MANLNTTNNDNTLESSYKSSTELIKSIIQGLNKKECDIIKKSVGVDEEDCLPEDVLYKSVEILMNSLQFTDNRQAAKVIYPLDMMVILIVMGWLCGARSALDLENFVNWHKTALSKIIPGFKDLKSLPSHDTFLEILSNIIFQDLHDFIFQFSQAFLFSSQISNPEDLKLFASDSQCVRGAREGVDSDFKHQYFLTLYSISNKQSLKQCTVKEKENENPVLREMLKSLNLDNCVITLDALHTQIETLKAIRKQNGYSLMQVKENQKTLYTRTQTALSVNSVFMKQASEAEARDGFVIERRITVIPSNKLLATTGTEAERKKINSRMQEWVDNSTFIFKIEKIRTKRNNVANKANLEESIEIAYGITDIPEEKVNGDIAKFLLDARRKHWSIENTLHWSLDTNLSQDSSFKVKSKTLLENYVLLNKLVDNVASNVVSEVKTLDKVARKRAGITGKKSVINKMANSPYIAMQYLMNYMFICTKS